MKQLVWGVIALSLCTSSLCTSARLYAQSANSNAVNALKAKIFDAQVAQQRFGNGSKFCKDLDGVTTFYFAQRDRVINLAEYHRSLQNLAKGGAFNPATRRPWTDADAAARWAEAQQEAASDKANCDLIASLPELQKQMKDLQSKPQGAPKPN
jgi:transcriptional regulator of acetoin/glycerol metabolism